MRTRNFMILTAAFLGVSCSELKNELPAPLAPGVKVHDASWSDAQNSGFHGRQLLGAVPAWNDQACRVCHGGDYTGGTSGTACFKCHAPYPHTVKFAVATGRHVGYLRSLLFPFSQCQQCHGTSYTGGPIVAISCEQSGCHVDATGNPKSPETCNTCHGTFSAAANLTGLPLLLSAAPPRDLADDTSSTAAGVGAHQKHLLTGTTGKSVKCQECHTVPSSVGQAGHLSPVQVAVFNDTLANLVTGSGAFAPHPSFDPNTTKCSNTYCHGSWLLRRSSAPTVAQGVYADTATVMTGTKASPGWTAGSTEGQCYSCHGGAPGKFTPAGHIAYALSACSICHGDVVDGSGNILNRAKHMNGVIDLVSGFGGPRPMQ
jgi:hypothetical protein